MSNPYFNASGSPADGSELTSSTMRTEFASIAAGFDKLPTLSGNGYKIAYVNASGTAIDVIGNAQAAVTFLTTPSSANLAALLSDETGSGAAVFATSPTLVTPNIGAATGTSLALGGGTPLTTTNRTGTGNLVLATSPTLVTPNIGVATATSVNSTKVSGSNFSVQLRPDSDTLNGSFGAQSVAIGWLSNGSGTGSANVTVGTLSGGGLTTGGSNTLVGYQAGFSIQNGANNTCIGNASASSSASISNEITLGNSSIATLRCQVTSITALSDARDKTDIAPLPSGIETVMALNPVRFTWNMRDGGKVGVKDAGFIAQDLQTVDDEWLRLVYAENPEKLEASYGRLIPVLVKAIQEQQQQINQLKKGVIMNRIVMLIIAALFATVAFAAEPAYWMKSYPGADQAKVQHCLAVAENAYANALNGGMDGVAWAVLAKGNAWDRCMEGK